MDYDHFFRLATANTDARPYPFQRRLAESPGWPLILDIPTGLGKTEAIVVGWLFRRLRQPDTTPTRLIYILPQRSLVDQTSRRALLLLENLSDAGIDLGVSVEVLMGGEATREWIEWPEKPAILIGTQDMILSRALNRGYAMSRFQWPMAFAWLHSDAWWVIDEVQLQGVGVTTAAQLQGLRNKFGIVGETHTTFASATLDPTWIDTVDHPVNETATAVRLEIEDLKEPSVRKRLDARKTAVRLDVYEPRDLAAAIVTRHFAGTRSLVIMNTVDRAIQVYKALEKFAPHIDRVLLHSRFRQDDRERHLSAALEQIDPLGTGRIVVATQVVEAGVDFSARLLVSDIAPWSSIVQRLGRCNRAGDDRDALFAWIEPDELKTQTAAPYDASEVREARDILISLEGQDLSPAALPTVPMKQEVGAILRRIDLLELFDTAPDLSGMDVDVSRFIRDADDFTVRVLWRAHPPTESDEVRRDELCPATKVEAERLLKRLSESGRSDRARISRPTSDEPWSTIPTSRSLRIGDIVWFECDAGGYSEEIGFNFASTARVTPIPSRADTKPQSHESETIASDARAFIGEAMSIETHADDAVTAARSLLTPLIQRDFVDARIAEVVETSARWHDAGKIHPIFQATMKAAGVGDVTGPWAKSSGSHSARHTRVGFRHEAVSALAWLHAHDGEADADLIAYLIMAHHGKVRLGAQRLTIEKPMDGERMICGIVDGELIPSAQLGGGQSSPSFSADLRIFDVGMQDALPTWGDRVGALCEDPEMGIFRLAYLEALVRIADWRASAIRHVSLSHAL